LSVQKKNIFLLNTNTTLPFVCKQAGGDKKLPIRDIQAHATFIKRKLTECYENSITQKKAAAIRYKEGVYLEFSSDSKYDLAIKSLENIPQGIRLLN